MIFSGITFSGGQHTLDPTPTHVDTFESLRIENGVFDDLYLTEDSTLEYTTTIPTTWDVNTVLHALFDGTLYGGNINLVLSETSAIRIKRREINSYKWITLYERTINSEDDFDFEFFDRYARANKEYEYAVVPVMANIEGVPVAGGTIKSRFEGVYILNKESIFGAILNIKKSESQKVAQRQSIQTMNSKYPFHIQNGKSNYYSGSTSGFFVERNLDTCDFDIAGGYEYRKNLMDFLNDGTSKILKYDDGRMMLIGITGTPTETDGGHEDMISTTFTWEEIGDCESSNDLYDHGLIDIIIERS